MKKRQRILLIEPPFYPPNQASIALGRLKAVLTSEDIDCDCSYLNVHFAAFLGDATTESLDIFSNKSITAELLYASELFPEYLPHRKVIRMICSLNAILSGRGISATSLIKRVRTFNAKLIRSWEKDLPYSVVGISATYQLMPALFCANAIKRICPDVKIVLGGPQLFGEVGQAIARTFPFVDWVIDGEGETALLGVIEAISKGSDLIPDGASRRFPDGSIRSSPQRSYIDLETLPFPDYDDYFKALISVGKPAEAHELPVESSRGCWWGRCSFCNHRVINQGPFRRISDKRVVETMEYLAGQHRSLNFYFTDSIQPPDVENLARALHESAYDFKFFMELRTNISTEALELLVKAGLNRCLMGIDSFSSSMMKKMRKGTTVIDNIVALREAKWLGLDVRCNLISPFPGELCAESRENRETLKTISHLKPSFIRQIPFILQYGSHVFNNPDEFGIKEMTPPLHYSWMLPAEYRFSPTLNWNFSPKLKTRSSIPPSIRDPKYESSLKISSGGESFCRIIDTRPCRLHGYTEYVVRSPYSDIILACRKPRKRSELDCPDEMLEELVEEKLLFEEDGQYVSLAVGR